MREIDEILTNPRITVVEKAEDGFKGNISFPTWVGSIVCSTGAGWEHISVAPYKRRYVPTWEDMSKLKELFFKDDEAVIQIHPPKAEYVNNMPNCLHLWRCTYKEMVLPPSILVGIRKGQTQSEIEKEIKDAYAMAGEEY